MLYLLSYNNSSNIAYTLSDINYSFTFIKSFYNLPVNKLINFIL